MKKFLNGKNIIITGATGYIGSTLLELIDHKTSNITVLSRNTENPYLTKYKNIKIFKGDIASHSLWESLLKGADYVFHLASLEFDKINFNQNLDYDINFLSVMNMLKACDKLNYSPKIIFTSSANIEKEDPTSLWSLHKLMAEKYLNYYSRHKNIKSVCIRIPNLYGFSGNIETFTNVSLNKIIANAIDLQEIRLYKNSQCARDFLNVEDAAMSLLFAAKFIDKLDNNYYYISGGAPQSYEKIFTCIKNLVFNYFRLDVLKITDSKNLDIFEMRSSFNDCTMFSLVTKFSPRINFESGLDNTLVSYAKLKGLMK